MALDGERRRDNEEVFSVILALESGPVKIISKDIVNLYFIEDIFSFCMTGKLIFHDMYGFVEKGPFTGNEQLVIEYGKDNDRQLIFDIWKIKDISQTSGTSTTSESLIELYFVDTIFEMYTLKRFSRGFGENKKITDIIEHILKNMVELDDKYINIEDSITEISNFCMPYWTPMEAISWLMRRAVGETSKTSGYLCYASTNNPFSVNIHTLNYLLSDRNYLEDDLYYFDSSDYGENKILEWWISSLDKTSTKIIRGGKWRGFDSSDKQPITTEYEYSDGVSNTTLLGRKSLFINISDNTTNNSFIGESDINLLNNIVYDKWCKRYNMQQIMNIVLQGHEKRYAGQQIEIVWPSSDANERYNKLFKGYYLVKSITHMLTPIANNMSYTQRMILIKNAYNDIDMRDLVKATEKRI